MNILSSSELSGKENCDVYYERLCKEGILALYRRYKPAGKVKENKNGTELVQCPNHAPDNNPSCSMNTQENVYCCHACGASGNIVNLLQLFTGKTGIDAYIQHFGAVPRQFPVKSAVKNANVKTNGKVRVIYYNYSEILRVVRTETFSDASFSQRINKTFRTEFLANGKWNTFYSHSKPLMDDLGIKLETTVYGDKESEILVINEGEKCVDLFREYGIAACCLHSSHKLKPLSALQLLKELNPNLMIVLAIDNDTAGEKFLDVYGDACRQLDINYRVIRWKDYEIPPGGDIAEFMEGRTKEDLLSVLENACQQPAGLYLGTQPQLVKSQKSDEISQLKQLADQLSGASESEIAAAAVEFKLAKTQTDLLSKLIKEANQVATARSILEHSIAVPGLSLELILPDCKLRQLLADFGENLQVPDAAIIMAFLTTVASRCTVGTSLTLRKSSNHSVPPYLYSVIVGSPGSGKTPLINAITTAPCRILQAKLDTEYQSKLSQYEAELRYFNSLSKEQKMVESDPPTSPVRKVAYVSDATTEAVVNLMEQNNQSAVFLVIDEFASMILNRGKYSKGLNSDAQFYNSAYSGQIPIVARKTTGTSGCGTGGVVILGGTQPALLQQLFSKSSAESGEWARYCFTYIPSVIRTIDSEEDSEVIIDFSEYLADVYQKIFDYGAKKYSLTKDAYRLWGTKSNEFNQKVINCHQPYLQHVYSKANEILGRFALVLHLADAALLEIEPSEQVRMETMSRAALLTDYYVTASAKAFSDMDLETQLFHSLLETLKINGTVTYGTFLARFNGAKRKLVESQFSIWTHLLEQQGLVIKKKAKNGYSLIYQQQQVQQPKILVQEQPSPIQQPLQQQPPAPIQEQEQHQPAPIEQSAPIQEPKIEPVQLPVPKEKSRIEQQQPPPPIQEQEQQQPAPIEQSAPIQEQEQPVQQPLQEREQERIPLGITDVKIKFYQDIQKYVIDYKKDGNVHTYDYFPSSIEEVLRYLPDYFGATDCLIYSSYGDGEAITESYLQAAIVRDSWITLLCSWFNKNKEKYAIAQ